MPVDAKHRPWWLEPGLEEKAGLDSKTQGLSTPEAKSRLAHFGPNLFRETREEPLLLQFIARFRNPLIIILLAASRCRRGPATLPVSLLLASCSPVSPIP
jgi:P-type Mg2+ transporter